MFSDIYFDKIVSKISHLKTALFLDFSESIVKFPTSIIQIISANEARELFFSIPRPYPDLSGMEKVFPIALHFYNKECNYYVNVDGFGRVMSEYEIDKELLVCVKINRMEYFEKGKNKSGNLFDPIVDLLRWIGEARRQVTV
jgi:hypothetical protein